jgi:hypothetical protein
MTKLDEGNTKKSGEALFARIEQLVDQVPVLVYRGTRAGLSRIESSGECRLI